MTTLITGGAGFVGLALAERLRGDGERVVLADLPARDGATSIAPPAGCEFVGGDLRDDAGCKRFVEGILADLPK